MSTAASPAAPPPTFPPADRLPSEAAPATDPAAALNHLGLSTPRGLPGFSFLEVTL